MNMKNSSTLHKWVLLMKRPKAGDMEPGGSVQRQYGTGTEDVDERGNGAHAEDVNPGRYVARLAFGKQLVRRQPAQGPAPGLSCPGGKAWLAVVSSRNRARGRRSFPTPSAWKRKHQGENE